METSLTWGASSVAHSVKRFVIMLTHAHYLTTTASQGQTMRAAVAIECARQKPQGQRGADDDAWWLNLYVAFSALPGWRTCCWCGRLLAGSWKKARRIGEEGSLRRRGGRGIKAAKAVLLAKEYGTALPAEE